MSLIYLFTATVYPTGGPSTTLRYASGLGYNHASAPAFYPGRIAENQVVQFSTVVSADPRTAGPQIAAGSVTVKDDDGAIRAFLLGCGVAGFAATLEVVDDQADYSTRILQISGKLAEPTLGTTTVTFNFQDRSQDLQGPMGRTVFAGSNSPNGTEGTANDVGGVYKPVCYGRCRNITPAAADALRAVDQVHDGQVSTIMTGRDKGVTINPGSARTFANIDTTTEPSAGTFDYFLGDNTHGAYARRVSTLLSSGPFTYDVDGAAPSGSWKSTVADIAAQILADRITSGPSTVGADVTALNAAAAGVVGFYNRDNVTVADALNQILPAAGAKWWFDAAGNFRMAQLAAPSGSPVANIRRVDLSVAKTAIDADLWSNWQFLTPDVPIVWKVTVRYQRYWTVQTQGLDANLSAATRAQISSEWRSTVASDASVLTQYPGAVEITVDANLDSATDAANLAATLLALLKVRRDTLQVDFSCSSALASSIAIGAVVKVFDILDYGTSGRLMRVLGLPVYDHLAGALRGVKLWG